MARTLVQTPAAPSSPYYSQGVIAAGLLRISGMAGIDPGTGALAGPTIAEQASQALANCLAIAGSCDAGKGDVVEVGAPRRPGGLQRGVVALVRRRPTGSVRRQAGRGASRGPRLDPDGRHAPDSGVT